MKCTKNLLKNIPIGKKELLINKMKDFEKVLQQSKTLSDISKGLWIIKVAGTDIYKFRVNSGDRILFKYENNHDKDKIIFIDFCNHDEQIHTAKNYKGSSIIDFEIDKQEYIEDEIDIKINEYIKNEVYLKLAKIKEFIIEDEYISVAIEDDKIEEIENIYLSQEQYECLEKVNKPSIIFGCAGSGKTMVAIRKLILNNKLNINTVYMTCSNMIIRKTRDMYTKFSDNEDFISFYTLRQICRDITGLHNEIVVDYNDFYNWIYQSELLKKEDLEMYIREIWIEINTVIKGSVSEKGSGKILSKNEYIKLEKSHFNMKQRKAIYEIVNEYKYWLNSNKYYDDNDLAIKALEKLNNNYKFDYIVYDEVQELTSIQLLLVYSITNNINNIMLLGDTNQSMNIEKFNLDLIKNIIFKNNSLLNENFIIKNYRNGSETINWINEFKNLKNSRFRSMGRNFEQNEVSIKEGIKPRVFYKFKKEDEFFHKIKEDVDSVVIVADQSDKARLEENGYELGRIFSIEEVRGLEYDNIYCYNILSGFNDKWDAILSMNSKCDDIYSVYFNMVYIAVTRAKNKLCFLEKRSTRLDDNMKNYWDVISNEDIILNELNITTDYGKWIEEAKKLEKMEKYYQAAEAYKKVGRLDDANICLEANKRKLNYINTDKFASYVLIEAGKLTPKLLEQALNGIEEKYDLSISGYMKIILEFTLGNQKRTIKKYIKDCLNNKEIASIIYKELDLNYIIKNRVVLNVCFYKMNIPVDTLNIDGEGFKDLSITFNNNWLKITPIIYESPKLIGELLLDRANQDVGKRYVSTSNYIPERESERLRNNSKYDSKTPDEIMDFIFKGKNI